jgi:type I restriction enzyme R subunit
VYDAGAKKIARYQQYFAIGATLDRVRRITADNKRQGGVIWHTQGSGKSLTMVMLAKALTLHRDIPNPRVVLVTDRIDLDEQLWGTFLACGKKVQQAESGSNLVRMVQSDKADLITTVINKFDAAVRRGVRDPHPNIFVLVDESHRSQYGSLHAKMARVFPNACYIGFTGTPQLTAEKATAHTFGGFIHKYTMRQAVEDQAVVPLLYEGRMAELGVDERSIDQWFERVTRTLSDEQKRDLKRKFSRNEEVSATEQRIQQIAFDITRHYADNFRGTGFKAQLAAPSKATALLYKRFLDEFGEVTSEVVISAPDTREGNDDVDESRVPEVQTFWKRMLERFGTEKNYNRQVKHLFGRADGIDILIVVDKLLTGFDEPRNTVLYIDKPLKEHSLLQAIARVNRLFEGKDWGYIIDYRGVLGELNAALNTYNALEGFDNEDVAGMITDVRAELARLPEQHAALWAIFDGVPNKRDTEALERHLEPEDRRHAFYQALAQFARALKVALGTVEFAETIPPHVIDTYKQDFKFFHNLQASVRQRYAEVIDYKEYEGKIRGLLNRHIQASEVAPITKLVNIFDTDAFEAEVERVTGDAAKADTIANRVKRTLIEHLEQDPATYRRFGQMIDATIQAYRDGRLSEAEYLTYAGNVAAGANRPQQRCAGHAHRIPASTAILELAARTDGELPCRCAAVVRPPGNDGDRSPNHHRAAQGARLDTQRRRAKRHAQRDRRLSIPPATGGWRRVLANGY